MRTLAPLRITLALLACPVLLFAQALGAGAEEEEFYLEGVIYEKSSPQDSIASINGEALQQGDAFGDYTVKTIAADHVILQPNDGGKNLRVNVWTIGRAPKPARTAQRAESPDSPSRPSGRPQSSDDVPESEVMRQKLMDMPQSGQAPAMPGGFDIGGMLNYAVEVKAMATARQIYTAAAATSAEEGGSFDLNGNMVPNSLSLETLVERHMVSETYLNPAGPYTFSLRGSGFENLEVHASPKDSKGSLRHFMIDEFGIMHAQRGGSATRSSPEP
jgi:hypothetical protein